VKYLHKQTCIRRPAVASHEAMSAEINGHLGEINGAEEGWELVAVTDSIYDNVHTYRFFWKRTVNAYPDG
jgi:hypothetical protein